MKTPGQKAYEAAKAESWLPIQHQPFGKSETPDEWHELIASYRAEWERIAAAVTVPEPKSYGQVAYEAKTAPGLFPWADLENDVRVLWDSIADSVIAEFKRREGITKP